MLHPFAQARNRIVAALPVLNLDLGAVGETVVACAVMRDAVAHRLNEHWFAAVGERHAARFLRGCTHGEDIVAVNADGVNAVAHATAGDAITAVLLQRWRRDRVSIIAANVDDGAGAGGGNIECSMEISFAGGALAEVAHYYSRREVGVLERLQLESVGCAGGLGDLCCEGGGDCVLLIQSIKKF